jgi:hypothetical protein
MSLKNIGKLIIRIHENTLARGLLAGLPLLTFACFLAFYPVRVDANERTDEQLLDDASLRYVICCARVEASLNEAETEITAVHLVFADWDTEQIAKAEVTAVFYTEEEPSKQSLPVNPETLAGDQLGLRFTPANQLIMKIFSPVLRAPVKFRLMEPYRSKEPATNNLRFVPY